MTLPRLAACVVLAVSWSVIPPAAAMEDFDARAKACAEGRLGDPPDTTLETEWFFRASVWAECLTGAVAAEDALVEDDLLVTLDRDARRLLKRRRKLLRRLGIAAIAADAVGGALATAELRDSKKYENGARKVLLATTDLRFLGLESFRKIWQHVLAGAELRSATILSDISDDIERLALEEGADANKHGLKALKFAALAEEAVNAMLGKKAEMAIAESALPTFGADEDKAAKRARKRFKGLGAEYGDLLVLLGRLQDKVSERVDKAIALARKKVPCTLTDPDDPFGGGGLVRVSVDGAPEVEWRGDTGISVTKSGSKNIVWIGSHQSARPRVLFELYGRKSTRKKTWNVLPRVSGDDAFQRDFAVGSYTTSEGGGFGGTTYWMVEGTLRVDEISTGKRRVVDGSFDVLARSDAGAERRLVGTFHLCGFGVERR